MVNTNASIEDSTEFCITIVSVSIPRTHHIFAMIAYAMLSLVTIVSNTVLIHTLYKTKQLNTISNKLILAMNISDLCAGVFSFPALSVLNLKKNFTKGCEFDKAASFFALFFGLYSFMMLCCISLDRYFQVTKLNSYNLFMNTFRMKWMICLCFAVSFIIAVMSTLNPSFLEQVISVLLSIFGITFAITAYAVLIKRLRSLSRARGNIATSDHSIELRRDRSNQLPATRTIQFLLVYLIISYIPYHIMSCWWTYYKFLKKEEPEFYINMLYECAGLLALFNACGNSWIILYGNSKSRRFVSSLFRRNRVENIRETVAT